MLDISKALSKYLFVEQILGKILNPLFKFVRKVYKTYPNDSEVVVIIALHKLGDTIFTFPAIEVIQKLYKKELVIVCYSSSKALYQLRFCRLNYIEAGVNDFFSFKKIAKKRLRNQIRLVKPAIIIDLTGVLSSASLIFNSGAKLLVGLNRRILNGLYDKFVAYEFQNHLSEMYINVALLLSSQIPSIITSTTSLNVSKIEKVFIHPFAGWKAKEWGMAKFIKLADYLKIYYNIFFVFPSDSVNDEILNELKSKQINFTITNSIDDLISVLKNCSILIGNDSGPIHIASLLGKPTFTLYGPTNPRFHMPLESYHSYIIKSIKCSPNNNDKMCFTNGGREGCPSNECMHSLSVDEVKEKLLLFIEELNSRIQKN